MGFIDLQKVEKGNYLELGPFRGSPRPTMTTLEEKETLTKSNVIIIA
jgi:hypothetical protein